ncbi:MAG: glycosyltransferase [Gammaproteobacteria bacterium]|nr:glycosyltransferase [Gammaproteobacteria bacterium]
MWSLVSGYTNKRLTPQLLFSIAIPVLGQANFLPTALSSVQVQTRRFQLAVMDATPDSSVQDILKDYSEILSYQRHGPDAGQSAAIQEGWDHTEGNIVAWLCADDYYFPYALEEVEKVFSAHPDVDVVYGDSVLVDRDGNFLHYFFDIDSDISKLLKRCCISQPSCFLRRSALERMGKLNTKLCYIMDWELWTRLYQSGARFYYLNKPLSTVRMYPETKTASRSKARYAEINRHLKKNVGFLLRIRVLLGFYYSDMRIERKSVFAKFVFYFLSLLRSIKNIIEDYPKRRKSTLYGFETSSNLVKGECEVVLPFYGKCLPYQLVIECRNVSALQVYVNDCVQNVFSVSCHGRNHRYVIMIKENLVNGLLKLNLSSNSTKPWQLTSVNIS